MPQRIYYESKKIMYGVSLGLLTLIILLSFIYASPIDPFFVVHIAIFFVMVVVVYFYPAAEISLFEDHLEFKKGSQKISVPWKDVLGIHKDPVSNGGPSTKGSNMGGVFLETREGYTKYFTPQLIRSKGTSLNWKDLENDLRSRSGAEVQEGAVSMFKQKSKLFDVIFMITGGFLASTIVILIYGIFTGTFSESIEILKDLFYSLIDGFKSLI